jgi:hypothetical protein
VKKVLFWGFIAIGGYLVLTQYKGFVADTGSAGTASVNLVKAFQGR